MQPRGARALALPPRVSASGVMLLGRMNTRKTTRRRFFQDIAAGSSLALVSCNRGTVPANAPPTGPADVTLRIAPVLADIAKDHTISTVGYNGQVPGPLIRLKEGVPVTVDLFNDTDSPEFVHWHGLIVPADVDGAAEEKSLAVPARGHLRYRLTPQPAGARFVHSHVMPMSDLNRGIYTGQFGFVYVEPKTNPGQYDQEIFLATHEWEPYFTTEEEMDDPDIALRRRRNARKSRTRTPNPTAGRSDISASRSTARHSAMASRFA